MKKLYFGGTGTGKTYSALKELPNSVRINFNPDMQVSEILGFWKLEEGKTTFILSQFSQAIKDGKSLILDEFNTANTKIQSLLLEVLDTTNPQLSLPNGEIIKVSPKSNFILTCNLGYLNNSDISPALLSRLDEIKEFDNSSEVNEIISIFNKELEKNEITNWNLPLNHRDLLNLISILNNCKNKKTRNLAKVCREIKKIITKKEFENKVLSNSLEYEYELLKDKKLKIFIINVSSQILKLYVDNPKLNYFVANYEQLLLSSENNSETRKRIIKCISADSLKEVEKNNKAVIELMEEYANLTNKKVQIQEELFDLTQQREQLQSAIKLLKSEITLTN